ncbi:MAG: AMP-binding protein, partial [Actinomycetales bacterium]
MEQLAQSIGSGHPPLLAETISANLRRTVASHPDHQALVDCPTGAQWTYAEFLADTQACARGLMNLGVGKGDRVGIWSPNR